MGCPALAVLGSLGCQPCLYWGHWGILQPHLPSPPTAQLCHQTVTPVPQPWCPSLPPPSSSPALAVPWGVPLSLLSPQSAPELWQWLWALRRATSANRDMLPTCHPGTFRAGRWTCCLQPTRAGRTGGPLGPGCPRGGCRCRRVPTAVVGSARVQPYPRRGGAGGVERPWGPRGGSAEPLRAPAVSPGHRGVPGD